MVLRGSLRGYSGPGKVSHLCRSDPLQWSPVETAARERAEESMSGHPLCHTPLRPYLLWTKFSHLSLLTSRAPPPPGFPPTSLSSPYLKGPGFSPRSYLCTHSLEDLIRAHGFMQMSPKQIPPDPSPKLQTRALDFVLIPPFGYSTHISKQIPDLPGHPRSDLLVVFRILKHIFILPVAQAKNFGTFLDSLLSVMLHL